jgi:hypothetical protein
MDGFDDIQGLCLAVEIPLSIWRSVDMVVSEWFLRDFRSMETENLGISFCSNNGCLEGDNLLLNRRFAEKRSCRAFYFQSPNRTAHIRTVRPSVALLVHTVCETRVSPGAVRLASLRSLIHHIFLLICIHRSWAQVVQHRQCLLYFVIGISKPFRESSNFRRKMDILSLQYVLLHSLGGYIYFQLAGSLIGAPTC